jgi:hypothetical protein
VLEVFERVGAAAPRRVGRAEVGARAAREHHARGGGGARWHALTDDAGAPAGELAAAVSFAAEAARDGLGANTDVVDFSVGRVQLDNQADCAEVPAVLAPRGGGATDHLAVRLKKSTSADGKTLQLDSLSLDCDTTTLSVDFHLIRPLLNMASGMAAAVGAAAQPDYKEALRAMAAAAVSLEEIGASAVGRPA